MVNVFGLISSGFVTVNKSKFSPLIFSLITGLSPPPPLLDCGIKSIAVSRLASFCVPLKVDPFSVHFAKQS